MTRPKPVIHDVELEDRSTSAKGRRSSRRRLWIIGFALFIALAIIARPALHGVEEFYANNRRARFAELTQLSVVYNASEASRQIRGPIFEGLAFKLMEYSTDEWPSRIDPNEKDVLRLLGPPDFTEDPLAGDPNPPKEWVAVGWKTYVWLYNAAGQNDAAIIVSFKLNGRVNEWEVGQAYGIIHSQNLVAVSPLAKSLRNTNPSTQSARQ
jgi:hypothetical protein